MTLTEARPATPPAPAPRSARLAALAVPGALLTLCSIGVASMAGGHAAIVHAVVAALH